MNRLKPWHIVVGGILILVGGFLYDLDTAGIPFPDPTQEQYADWIRNGQIASNIMIAGLAVSLLGTIWMLLRKLISKGS